MVFISACKNSNNLKAQRFPAGMEWALSVFAAADEADKS